MALNIRAVSVVGSLFLFVFSANSNANITLNNTRIIYPANKKEVTVMVMSNNNMPVLIQNWIDNGDARSTPETTTVPFILTPPITRIEPGKGQTLRLINPGVQALPTDRESVFWLNVLEIPPKKKADASSESKLRLTFRTRVKIFYRPVGLPDSPEQAVKSLRWSVQGENISVTNPSPYFVSLSAITVREKGKDIEEPGRMIAPGESDSYTFKGINLRNVAGLTYSAINDFGEVVSFSPAMDGH